MTQFEIVFCAAVALVALPWWQLPAWFAGRKEP